MYVMGDFYRYGRSNWLTKGGVMDGGLCLWLEYLVQETALGKDHRDMRKQ